MPEHGATLRRAYRLLAVLAATAFLFLLPHILSFSQQELLVFLAINVLIVAS